MTRPRRILIAVSITLAVVVFFVVAFMIGRGCAPTPPPEPVLVEAPDGGEAARAIETRLDASIAVHEEQVQVIERRVVVLRDRRALEIEAEERAVRARGRAAVAAWLADFDSRLRDAGVPDAGP